MAGATFQRAVLRQVVHPLETGSMNTHHDLLSVTGITVEFNPDGGSIRDLAIDIPGADALRPLHVAPWVRNAETLSDNIPLVERQLAGDFFCAPFGSVQGLPVHGASANATWHLDDLHHSSNGSVTARYSLPESIHYAHVTKRLTLHPNHPCLYQQHRFTGGSGHLPIAHHTMIHVPGGVQLSFSPRQFGVTPLRPPESDPRRGRSLLRYPQTFNSLDEVRSADGEVVDASFYPYAEQHEDIVVLAGAASQSIGWTAALAQKDGFLFFSIKDARVLPETILWMSNGGRYYAPWSSRHTAVLGLEEAATSCHANQQFSSEATPSRHGIASGLSLDPSGTRDIRYCCGAIPAPTGWTRVADIRINDHTLVLQDIGGDERSIPFDGGFIKPSDAT